MNRFQLVILVISIAFLVFAMHLVIWKFNAHDADFLIIRVKNLNNF